MEWRHLLLLALGAIAITRADDLLDINIPDEFLDEELASNEEEYLRQLELKHIKQDLTRENNWASKMAADIASELEAPLRSAIEINPCAKVHCGAGRICQASEDNTQASCVCIPDCPEEDDPRRKVCTNRNETWNSDCDVYRQRCLCDSNHEECMGKEYQHVHIDYYGACRESQECSEEEMKDFPRRMRDWLFNVMRDMAERNELTDHYMQMRQEAETNLTRRWSNAAVWKWCDLDGHGDQDRTVSRHELFPIRAPLVSLEHCIAPFLETCDPNGDHRISLKEWGTCLELDEADMVEQCDEIAKEKESNPNVV